MPHSRAHDSTEPHNVTHSLAPSAPVQPYVSSQNKLWITACIILFLAGVAAGAFLT